MTSDEEASGRAQDLKKSIVDAGYVAIDAGVPHATVAEWCRSAARYFEFMDPNASAEKQASALVPD